MLKVSGQLYRFSVQLIQFKVMKNKYDKCSQGMLCPLLKKSSLDASLPANYRPISNLNNISKILEKLLDLARGSWHVYNRT